MNSRVRVRVRLMVLRMMRFVRSRPWLRLSPAMAMEALRIHSRAILKPPPCPYPSQPRR